MDINNTKATEILSKLFYAAVDSARAKNCIAKHLPATPKGRTIVIGFGKASAAMAYALEQLWTGPLEGAVVTRYGHSKPCKHIDIIEASHPNPDDASVAAAQTILQQLKGLTADDLVICLISGGGSALLCLPQADISLAQLQDINQQLLHSGASIHDVNCVRRHLSAIKGGRLAQACYPAKLVNLIISDVPGDDLHNIASGPTVPDHTTCADALKILHKYQIQLPDATKIKLESGLYETIKPDNHIFERVESKIIASPKIALQAAAQAATAAGLQSLILSDTIEGEAQHTGEVLANIAQQIYQLNAGLELPLVLLSGGETTVTVKGNGVGGRNVELILAAAIYLNGVGNIYALAADTDGIDGQAEIAGAFIYPDTLARAKKLGLSALEHLNNNDAHSFFGKLNNSFITGPSFTNVNDFRAFLVI